MKKILFLVTFLFTLHLASAQQKCIEDFEAETTTPLLPSVGNWQAILGSVAFENDNTTNLTQVLRGNDGSGGSWMYNPVDYRGDWLAGSCEFCFDIRYVAGLNNPDTGFNAIYLFQGTSPSVAPIRASFQVNTGIGNAWQRVCVPIDLASGPNLPSNAYGQWVGVSPAAWTSLITNVSGIAFLLDFGGGSNPVEDVYVDNLCFKTCADTCALVVEDKLICDSNGYTYTFSVQNNTGLTVDGIIINNQYDPSANIPPLGTYGPVTLTIPASAYPTFCFDMVLFSENLECCHYEHCIDLPLCYPCDSIELVPSNLVMPDGDSCCFLVDVINNFANNYFTSIVSTILTPGVNFTGQNGGADWSVTPATGNGNVLTWTPAGGFIAQNAATNALKFCLTDILHLSQTPQFIQFDWMVKGVNGMDSIACSDTLSFFCETCLGLYDEEITCLPNGDYQYCMTIANNDASNTATAIYFDVYSPAGVQFSPNNFPVNIAPNSSASVCVNIPGPLPAGSQVKYKIILKNFNGDSLNWCCIVDTFCVTIPTCNSCTCGTYSDMSYRPFQGAPNISVECKDTLVAQCNGQIPWTFGGNFLCSGNSCPDSTWMSWLLLAPDGTSSSGGSMEADPGFQFLIPATDFNTTGDYHLTLKAKCGQDTCECDFVVRVECDACTCDSLQSDVDAGFSWIENPPFTISFTPTALHDNCDSILWTWGDGSSSSSLGAATISHVFPAVGTYFVCMIVTRIDPSGQICQAEFCINIDVTGTIPIKETEMPEPQLLIYPNPTNGQVTLSIPVGFGNKKECYLSLQNIQGQVLLSFPVESDQMQMDLAPFPEGLYFLSLCNRQGKILLPPSKIVRQ